MLGYGAVVDRTGPNWQDVLSEGERARAISATACYPKMTLSTVISSAIKSVTD
jgi:hypothetical protein